MSESPTPESTNVFSNLIAAARRIYVPERNQMESDGSKGTAIILSVIASILIWFMISMRESYSVVRDFPTTVVNVPPDRALRSPPPATIRVQVEGRGWQLLKLITSPQAIRIDGSTPTVDLYRATAESLPADLRPQSVSPPEVRLLMEERRSKRLPIRIDANVQTVAPFDLVHPVRAIPESVAVSGASTIVAGLSYWLTEHFERDKVNESFTSSVALKDTLGGLVDVAVSSVLLQAEIAEFTEHRRQLEVRVTGAPEGASRFQLIPDRVTVRYTVPLTQFEAAAISDSFYASVPYTTIVADTTGRIEPTIHTPEYVVIKDVFVETPRLQYYVILE